MKLTKIIAIVLSILTVVALTSCNIEININNPETTSETPPTTLEPATIPGIPSNGLSLRFVYVQYVDENGFGGDDLYVVYPDADQILKMFDTAHVEYYEEYLVDQPTKVTQCWGLSCEEITYHHTITKAEFVRKSYGDQGEPTFDKPVIYFYPETETDVSVQLILNGQLTCTYPDYEKGWNNFIAKPDGTLKFSDGKEYYCLYWEGKCATEFDFSRGFCVKGSDTAQFLENILPKLGLNTREANEFIIYWLPQMQNNNYNLISFQTNQYTDNAELKITPNPDILIRVFMAYKPLMSEIDIEPQEFETPVREGFAVVEWGGSEVK